MNFIIWNKLLEIEYKKSMRRKMKDINYVVKECYKTKNKEQREKIIYELIKKQITRIK